MDNGGFRQRQMAEMPVDWLRAFAQGLRDGGSDGWPSGWETASTQQQIAYEQGRLWGAQARASGIPVPDWGGQRSMVDGVENMRIKVYRIAGSPVPPKARPDKAA